MSAHIYLYATTFVVSSISVSFLKIFK